MTGPGAVRAFTGRLDGNWHPLTVLSHQLDGRLYGLVPFGHHLTSLHLHMASAILLFLVLRQAAGILWRSRAKISPRRWKRSNLIRKNPATVKKQAPRNRKADAGSA